MYSACRSAACCYGAFARGEGWRPPSLPTGRSSRLRVVVGAEAVAEAGFGDEVAGLAGVGLEFVAEVFDTDAEAAGVAEALGAPDFADELVLDDDGAEVAGEAFEDAVLEGGEVDLALGAAGFAACEVDFNVAQVEHRGLLGAADVAA